MKLIEPTMEYARQIRAYRKEFLDSGDSMDGTSKLRHFDDPGDWIAYLDSQKAPGIPDRRAPAEQYIFVREEDRKIVGMIDTRYILNDYLEKFGGNIGYSVAPGERRRGYASRMLHLVLPKFRDRGIGRVLVTCIKGNEGSRKTILKNGGIYESTVYEPGEDVDVERYWIDLSR